ncbi:MAG TPA: lipopolysaccharide biosynthesis protein [Acidobacteriaceae bacterium]|jgi:PST family polysaccharide transporter|nr:lipopolysaccharide biosynthesis protein [Acidobacteriaceae bacterium]
MKDLKERTIRGGYARMGALAANFGLRLGSLMVLARLLNPRDFGLLGMVTAFTGVLSLFRDFGLSAAAVQLPSVTEEQSSTLFWVNLLVGTVLTILAVGCAPAVSSFYHEPRLLAVTAVVASGFLFTGAGVQHSAILQREMRFSALAFIDVASWLVSVVLAILAARAGYGYWALVIMSVCQPLATTVGLWAVTRWIPGRPRRGVGLASLMRFGGTLTLNSLVVYVASNFDKILLGRFWGADALGIYGRAYQIVRIPIDNLNSGAGEVAFAALSRLQDDPPRLRNYFLKGYSLILALTVPVTFACGIFASDVVRVLLGAKWGQAVPIFRLLSPTILVFAISNPLGWLLSALGLVSRGLKIGLVIGPLMIASYFLGLPYGPKGVALAYSAIMVLWAVPGILWCIHGTIFSFMDILQVIARPLIAVVPASALAFGVNFLMGHGFPPVARLLAESATLSIAYLALLFFAPGQKSFYFELLRALRAGYSAKDKDLVSTP